MNVLVMQTSAVGTALLLLAACSREEIELRRAVSPDSRAVATLIAEVVPGAVGDTTYYLYVHSVDQGQEFGRPHLTASGCPGLLPAWSDDATLNVNYEAGCHIRQFNSLWYDRSDIGEGKFPARRVDIVLKRTKNVAQASAP